MLCFQRKHNEKGISKHPKLEHAFEFPKWSTFQEIKENVKIQYPYLGIISENYPSENYRKNCANHYNDKNLEQFGRFCASNISTAKDGFLNPPQDETRKKGGGGKGLW